MIEILLLLSVIVGFILVGLYLARDTRDRRVRDTVRVRRTADAAEREMNHRRDRFVERERRRRLPSRRRF